MSGTIPPELGKLSTLKRLDLSNNHFYGDTPASLGHLQSLQYLKLSNNSISGAFPVSALNLSQLIFLDLSYYNLSGPLPPVFLGTYNIVGNPLICGAGQQKDCFGIQPMANLTDTQRNVRNHKVAVALGSSIGCISFLFLIVGLLFWWRQRRNRHILFDIDGSGQCRGNKESNMLCSGHDKASQRRA